MTAGTFTSADPTAVRAGFLQLHRRRVPSARLSAGRLGFEHADQSHNPAGAVPVLLRLCGDLNKDYRRISLAVGEPHIGEGIPELFLLRLIPNDLD